MLWLNWPDTLTSNSTSRRDKSTTGQLTFGMIYSHVRNRMPEVNICERASAYRIPAKRIEGGDVLAIHEAARESLAAIHGGTGPQFLECMTYRWRDHVGPGEDRHIKYRPDTELDDWIGDDQVVRLAGMLDAANRDQIESSVNGRIAAAQAAAEESPFPGPEIMYTNVYQ